MKTKQTKLEPIPHSLIVIAWILVLGSMAPMLDSTMVNIAVNQLNTDFHTTLSMVQWTVTGFILAMGAAAPFSGWLVNRFSGKFVYLWSELFFGIASLLSGISWNIDSLIIFRLLQGFAAGLIMPLLFTLLVDSVGSDKMGRIMAIVGVPMTLGPMVGPIIGGLIVQYASWRWIFFINLPIVAISVIMLLKKVPYIAPKNLNDKFDGFGVALLAVTSGTVVYGIVQASNHGSFNNPTTLTYVSIGVALMSIYIIYAMIRKTNVVLPLNLFKHRNFSGSMLGIFLSGFVTSGPMLLLPLFFQDVRGESAVMAAIALIPQSIGMLVSRGLIGKLIDTRGARWVVGGGVIITIIGTLPFVYFDQKSSYLLIAIIMFVRGVGGAAIKSATQADTYVGLDRAESAPASLSSNLFQQVGSGFASAVLATVVEGYITTHQITSATHLAGAYQQGFLWSLVFVIVILIPAMMLTNKINQK
ncbi:MAG: MDR family MFS transporter [Sporolactobacillus sp.]